MKHIQLISRFLAVLILNSSCFYYSGYILPTSAQVMTAEKADADRLYQQGLEQFNQDEFPQALQSWQEALKIYQAIGASQQQAETISQIGFIFYWLSEYNQALDYYQQGLVIVREIGDRQLETEILKNLGDIYYYLGEYSQALDYCRQSLAIAREISNLQQEWSSLWCLGTTYSAQKNHNQAQEYYQQSLVIARKLGELWQLWTSLWNLGLAYYYQQNYTQAIDYYQQSLTLAQQREEKTLQVFSLNGLGQSYFTINNYLQAEKYYQQSLKLVREIGDRQGEGDSLYQLGFIYYWLNDYGKAIDYYEQSLAIAQEMNDRNREWLCLHGLGDVYFYLGNYAKAIEYHQASLESIAETGDRHSQATALNGLGNDYYLEGDLEKATEFYQQALMIAESMDASLTKDTIKGNALSGLGQTYLVREDYAKAINYHQQSLAIFREAGNRYNEGASLNNLGIAYLSEKDYDQAINLFQQSLAIAQEDNELYGIATAFTYLGLAYFKSDNLSEAETSLRKGIVALESIRQKLGRRDQLKISLFDSQTLSYVTLQQVLIAQNRPEDALEIAERGRARAFVELMSQRQLSASAELTSLEPPTIDRIRQIASDRQETLVEYSVIDSASLLYIWIIQPEGEVFFRQVNLEDLPQSSLTALVDSSRASFGVRGRGLGVVAKAEGNSTYNDELKRLYALLLEPIADLLPNDPEARITFIPQGSLFFVPFPALKDEDGLALIEKHTILTAPSIQVLELIHQQSQLRETQPPRDQKKLVVGNPTMPKISLLPGERAIPLPILPNAELEALEIAQLLKTDALIGSEATETDLVKQIPQAQIIHLATHGLLDDFTGTGMPGAIALAPSTEDDGLLTTEEILGLKINADLVVLSACDTGGGRITGDGVIGLSRSLLTSGASSLVVSLWSVPDAPTAELMKEFYEQLQHNPDKSQALRQAMLTIKKKYPNPLNWAAFTIIGETESKLFK